MPRCLVTLALLLTVTAWFAPSIQGQDMVPAEFRGDWVLQAATCQAPLRLRVAATTLTLVNGAETQTWSNLGVPTRTGFFGPDYRGISVVVLPDYDKTQPFTIYFNDAEKRGLTRVEIFVEMQGPQNAQVAALQNAARRLAQRFPLNNQPLKKCS